MRSKYLIIGNSAGGIGAAEAIREVDKEGSLAIVSDEPYPAYSRPLIAKYLAGELSLQGMLYRPADFYVQNNILFLPGKKVTHLELDEQTAQLEDGEQICWEKLLLATGGMAIAPKIEGIAKKGVFGFTTFDDAGAIGKFLQSGAKKAVVIGGGLIGISVAEALMKRGVEVTIIELKERILNTILDEQASLMAERAIRQAGAAITTGHIVTEISGTQETEGIILDNGEVIPCDLVVVAIGVLPRTRLALDAGMKVNRGIVVDRHMAASHQDVYSCGDVAEAYDFVYGEDRLTPIWPNAYIGGRIAGYNMAGVEAEYPGGTAINSLNYFGIDIISAGMPTPPNNDSYEVISQQEDSLYQKVVLQDDLIKGMIFVGNIEKSGIVFGLMRDRVNVASFKQSLLSDGFGLAFLPRTLWQARLETPPGLNASSSFSIQTEEIFAGE
jgi:NAD(P)H-nitrite reductase large subunit